MRGKWLLFCAVGVAISQPAWRPQIDGNGNLIINNTIIPGTNTYGPSGNFAPAAVNPVGGGLESSVIINADGSCDKWFNGGVGPQIEYTHASDDACEVWSTPVSITGTGSNYNYSTVFKLGSTYYLAVTDAPTNGQAGSNLYLYTSTNKTAWTIANGGTAIFTAGAGGTWYQHIYNPSIAVVGSTWYLLIDNNAGTGYSSATGCPSSCNFNTNVSSTLVIATGGNPDLIYVPDNNALVVLTSDGNGGQVAAGYFGVLRAYVGSTGADLSQPANWVQAPGFYMAAPTLTSALADPSIAFTPATGRNKWSGILTYNYNQNQGWQAYTNLTLDQWYTAITTPQSFLPPSLGGAGLMTSAPPWLRFFGNGEDGAFTCTVGTCTVSEEHWYTTVSVSAGAVMATPSANDPLIIRATGTCTIAGTISVSPNTDSGGVGITTGAQGGGGGGGGGGGTGVGAAGASNSFGKAGTAGGAGGGAGGNSSAYTITVARQVITNGIPLLLGATSTMLIGGNAGGAGGSSGGAGGKGGQTVALVCKTINFTGTIDASGQNGTNSPGNNQGAGGGGGGGMVLMSAQTYSANTGTINIAGGSGGTCGAFTGCGVGGNGGNGNSYQFKIQ